MWIKANLKKKTVKHTLGKLNQELGRKKKQLNNWILFCENSGMDFGSRQLDSNPWAVIQETREKTLKKKNWIRTFVVGYNRRSSIKRLNSLSIFVWWNNYILFANWTCKIFKKFNPRICIKSFHLIKSVVLN